MSTEIISYVNEIIILSKGNESLMRPGTVIVPRSGIVILCVADDYDGSMSVSVNGSVVPCRILAGAGGVVHHHDAAITINVNLLVCPVQTGDSVSFAIPGCDGGIALLL